MKAMILAAGRGERLGELTQAKPKPLLEVDGRPLLEHSLLACRAAGITDVIINLHHLGGLIRERFGDGKKFGINITYSEEVRLLGTAGALRAIDGILDGRFLLVYGDNRFLFPFSRILDAHDMRRPIATLACYPRTDVRHSGEVKLSASDEVTSFVEKPEYRSAVPGWVFAGLAVLEREVIDFVPPETPSDFATSVVPAILAASRRVEGLKLQPGSLAWIDTQPDYDRVIGSQS